MMKKRLFLLLSILMGFAAQGAAQNDVLSWLLFGNTIRTFDIHHVAPLLTDAQRAGLRDQVVKIVFDKTGDDMDRHDTIYYNSQGYITRIVSRNESFFRGKRLKPTVMECTFTAEGRPLSMTETAYSLNYAGEEHVEVMKSVRSFIYENGKLVSEYDKAYTMEKGKWKEFLASMHTEPVWKYSYDANGQLATTKGEYWCREGAGYNSQGWLIGDQSKKTFHGQRFAWDAVHNRYLSVSAKTQEEDMDGEMIFSEVSTNFTYNDKGDIVKAVTYYYNLNSRGTRVGKPNVHTRTISYVYDAKGNWTKATIREGLGKNAKVVLRMSRAISY
jgi:hypothetical protein